MDYKFKLLKIHCAGCALALEQSLNQIEGVTAEINFVTKVLKLKIETESPADTLTEVKVAINRFDHSIEIVDFEDKEEILKREKESKILKYISLSVAFVILILNSLLPMSVFKIIVYFLDYILISYPSIISAYKNTIHGKLFDENFLMVIASVGAFIIGQYFEAVMVMLLYNVGSILEELATNRSRKAISSLLEIKQPYANLYDGETDIKVPLDRVKVGDLIRIKPGERVPLDSVVVQGTSYLDVSALTGESIEKVVTPGSEILSGSINGSSVLLAKVQKLEAESVVSKIVEMVEKASETKAKSEKFISEFSKYYTPTVIALAMLLMFIPPIFSGYTNFSTYAYRALSFLVASCPCALVISVPLTYYASIGSYARNGILVKGATYVETLSRVNTILFDKTGTLTEGNFEITEIFAQGERTKDEILETIAYAENFSNHRIALSILETYKEKINKPINSAWINDYTEVPGKGIMANIFMQDVIVGNSNFLKENDVKFYPVSRDGTVIYLAICGEYAGYIVIEDMVKKDSELMIKKLGRLGIRDICLCTGDEKSSAKAVSDKVGIEKFYANLLPEDKVMVVTDKVQNKRIVAFVGDGINDAPSLANSNVGISMGKFGSDIAVDASDVVILTDEPLKVAYAIKKAKKTHKIVIENIFGSIGIKIAILFCLAFGISGMWLAVFADVGVNLIAVINSLRALFK